VSVPAKEFRRFEDVVKYGGLLSYGPLIRYHMAQL